MNYGYLLGGIRATIIILLYVISITTLINWWLTLCLTLLTLFIGFISVAKAKHIQEGFITFKEAFTSYFITIAIGLLISLLVGIVIFNFVDVEAAEFLNEQIIETQREMMARFGAPESEIEKALAEAEGKNNYALGNQFLGYAFQLVIYSILGLLVALIMKKSDPRKQ